MEEEQKKKKKMEGAFNGFSPISSTPVFWKSRKRSEFEFSLHFILGFISLMMLHAKRLVLLAATLKNIDKSTDDKIDTPPEKHEDTTMEEDVPPESSTPSVLSAKRKALFEPLEPIKDINGRRPSNESLLPPPDFESASYPKGWLVGKKRKLVNVDVVESMRRIAVQEMNRKDREIDGLNEQLEEDARCLEHLQLQLLEERSKRSEVDRQNAMLQSQVTMLMSMLEESEPIEGEGAEEP